MSLIFPVRNRRWLWWWLQQRRRRRKAAEDVPVEEGYMARQLTYGWHFNGDGMPVKGSYPLDVPVSAQAPGYAEGIEGGLQGAAQFSGNEGLCTLSPVGRVEPGHDFTIAFWVLFDAPFPCRLIGRGDQGNGDLEWMINTGEAGGRITVEMNQTLDGTNVACVGPSGFEMEPGVWYLLMFWYDGVEQALYAEANGDPATQGWNAIHRGFFHGNADLRIGYDPVMGHFAGRMDALYIWDRLLGPEERAQLYNGGAGFFYPFVGWSPV